MSAFLLTQEETALKRLMPGQGCMEKTINSGKYFCLNKTTKYCMPQMVLLELFMIIKPSNTHLSDSYRCGPIGIHQANDEIDL